MLIQNWREFADVHILDKEIDPLYEFLYAIQADKGPYWANRFTLHLLMFYDVGGAVKCANETTEDTFWGYTFGGYDTFPRGTNRRHSRGALGLSYITNLASHGSPVDILPRMYAPIYRDLTKLMDRNFPGCGFGPYFIWKLMDFQDRCFGRPVRLNLDDALKFLPDEPRKGAALIWPDRSLKDVLIGITGYISQYPAPGAPTRNCGFAEAESLLCALRGYHKGTYHHGKDLEERHRQLAPFPDLIKYLPPLPKEKYERPATLDSATLSAGLP